jgi:hypothetical protein
MIDHKEIKNIILNYEAQFPVDEWKLNGVDIWPNIRFKLYFHLLNHGKDKNIQSPQKPASKLISSKRKPLQKLVEATSAISKYLLFYLKAKNIDYLFMGLNMHRVLHLEKWYNRFFDPIIDEHNSDFSYMHLEIGELTSPIARPSTSYHLSSLLRGFLIVSGLRSIILKPKLEEASISQSLQDFFEDVNNQSWYDSSLKMDFPSWNRWTLKVREKSNFFLVLFKKTNLKGLIMASYYGYEDTAAAIYAAHKLKIPSSDFQHGPQTGVHMAYSSWSLLPENGFNTMPTHYWCWDQKSANNINTWNVSNTAVALGNTWLQTSMKQIKIDEQKFILYSLQVVDGASIEYFFPPNILKAINTSSVTWKLRLHPRSIYGAEETAFFLAAQGVDKESYLIESSKTCPLLKSLYESVLHVTNFSGCLIEAYQLGIPTLVVAEEGKDFYEDYIDFEKVYYKNKYDIDFIKYYTRLTGGIRPFENKFDTEIASPLKLFNSNEI